MPGSEARSDSDWWAASAIQLPNRLSYDPDALPACDHCGAAQPSFWHSFEPPQTEEVDLPELRHDGWDALSPREQDQRLNDELDQILQG